jgi:DNA-binding Lrp family transcriptional regulator
MEKERAIIAHLRKDARSSLASISSEVQMPLSTVYDKLNRLQNKVIKRFTTLIDFSELGYHHNCKLVVKVPPNQREELFNFLSNCDQVNSLYEVNGGFDYMVETIHKDIKQYTHFVERLGECFDLVEFHEYQVIAEHAREKFMS